MELRQQLDINTTPKIQKSTDKQSHFKENDDVDLEQNKQFKDQLNEQIDQVKAQDNNQKINKNQQDENYSVESEQTDNEMNGNIETGNNETGTDVDKGLDTKDQQETLNGQQVDDVTNPLIALNLPETGSVLPLSSADSTVLSSVSSEFKQIIGVETSVSIPAQDTISDMEMSSKRISELINKTPLTSSKQNSELISADVRTPKAVSGAPNLTATLSEKANIQDARYSKVMSEMPTADVLNHTTKMQQVPLTTAISASHASIQNVSSALPVESGSSLPGSTPTSNTLNSSIAANLQNPNWSQQMTQQVAYMVKGGFQQADIKLNPAHLGPMEIKLTLNDDNAKVSFVAQHAPVRDAIDAAMPRLKEMLEQQGLNLSDANVSTQSEQKQANTDSQHDRDMDNNGPDALNDNLVSDDVNDERLVNVEVNTGVSIFA
ncbi:MAG: flagellar hook-length control protein FliK [Gammaproteobacteria bacterium]|nr:flagellar hook-length control protein FliK [Gammaproteobacteria bacterium]